MGQTVDYADAILLYVVSRVPYINEVFQTKWVETSSFIGLLSLPVELSAIRMS